MDDFKLQLEREGFTDCSLKSIGPGVCTAPHSHDFAVRALVTIGEITLTAEGTSRTYRAGDVFTMEAGCEHAEQIGAQGVSYMFGRRQPT